LEPSRLSIQQNKALLWLRSQRATSTSILPKSRLRLFGTFLTVSSPFLFLSFIVIYICKELEGTKAIIERNNMVGMKEGRICSIVVMFIRSKSLRIDAKEAIRIENERSNEP